MVFSSLFFLFAFLPVTLLLYFAFMRFGGIKWGNIILLISSMVFIWWGSGKDILILLFMTIVNYIAGLLLVFGNNGMRLTTEKRTLYQKCILAACILISLGLLAYFKYMGFAASTGQRVLALFGVSWTIPESLVSIILPLGISFYTFQALSYTFDVYFGNVDATRNLMWFALYISMFPQLIAGPIVRYIDVYRELSDRSISVARVFHGAMRFLVGFVKKVLLANIVAKAADGIFSLPISDLTTALAWVGVFAYTLQIFLDFSAYSDMAIGLGEILGFNFLENFDYPYCAKSVQDFWRRWHISLSSWFRDYLYIPLGGSHKGKTRTYLNLMIVFFLCGLWHGAAWTFILWGLWHGFFLIIERLFWGRVLKKIPAIFGAVYMLLVVMIGWALFRSENLTQALVVVKTMFGFSSFSGELIRSPFEYLQTDVIIAATFGVFVSLGLFKYLKNIISRMKHQVVWENIKAIGVLILFLISIANLYSGAYNPFIYFRF